MCAGDLSPHIVVPLSTSLAHALLAPHSPSLEFLAIAQVASQTVQALFHLLPTFQHRNGDCGHQRTPYAAEAADERAQGGCVQYAIVPCLEPYLISFLILVQQFHPPKTATSPSTLPRVMVAEVSKPLHSTCSSEYMLTVNHFSIAEFISGFSGSAGTAVISLTQASLSTDGRYFNQAAKQLDNNWTLLKRGIEGVPTWQEWYGPYMMHAGILLDQKD